MKVIPGELVELHARMKTPIAPRTAHLFLSKLFQSEIAGAHGLDVLALVCEPRMAAVTPHLQPRLVPAQGIEPWTFSL
jgi:hypothetical protein